MFPRILRLLSLFLPCCLSLLSPQTLKAQNEKADRILHEFQRQELTSTYYSEGVNFGDINKDGVNDIVYGPYWFAGPSFKTKHEIFPAKPQPTAGYANHFFAWTYDFNGDNWPDILTVGFPGTPAYVYQNPGRDGLDKHWPKHEVFHWISNESPQFKNLVGDETPELVCSRDGFYGYLTWDSTQPFSKWTFHEISKQVTAKRFGHGLGVGDVNGDKRMDVLASEGWFEQPTDSPDGRWKFHPFRFAAAAADLFAYDVDGDGDNDIITSLSAHNYGLAWYEQTQRNDQISFQPHTIMGKTAEENPYGVLFTELHSVNLADIDGDGLKDICTGKTYWSHHKQSPMWDTGAVVYWFRLQRTKDGVNWIPYKADGESGIGRQLIIGDVNGDKLPDMLAGGMKGCHVLLHKQRNVSAQQWLDAQPQKPKQLAAGLPPKDAAKNMTVPRGFHVELAAGEPQIHQPIAFTYDHRGRLWVAEAYTYPQRAKEGAGKDRIVILEDTNLDGTLDSRKEFATGLNLVSGLEVGFGGVWVGAAPYLMFIPDANADDKPDAPPQILLDGFGYQDTHETLNSFIWGPDGWLYGCQGVFCHSKIGKPGTADSDRIPMNAGVWRYHPRRHVFEPFAHGTSNPWGVDFNDHGDAFITACVIPHLFHVIPGARYHRQAGQHFNPHTYDDIKTIADHRHYTGNIRDHAWWGHEPQIAHGTSEAGGGHAHCGAMIYLADNWPAEYRNSIYFNNIHGNRVNNDILEPHGSGFVGRHGKDLLLANDRWYRGINLKYGPDGTVHLIDWYDPNACHRTNPEIWDRSNGRIYRLSYGRPKPARVDLGALSNVELAKLQSHSNDWYVRTARRLLQERFYAGDDLSAAHHELRSQLQADSIPQQLRALWALHVTGEESQVENSAARPTRSSPHVLAWKIRLAMNDGFDQADLALLKAGAGSASPVVQLATASALQSVPADAEIRWQLGMQLAKAIAADDHNLPLMVWYALEPLVPTHGEAAMQLADTTRVPLLSRYLVRRAAGNEQTIGDVIARLSTANNSRRHIFLDEIQRAFAGRVGVPMPASWQQAYEELLKSKDATIREKADRVAIILGDKRILGRMRDVLADAKKPIEQRKEALNVILLGRDPKAAPALIEALDTPRLRRPALRALAGYAARQTPQEILSRYGNFDAKEKQDAIGTLTARAEYAHQLLDAIATKTVNARDVSAFTIRQLERLNDPKLMNRVQSVWGKVRATSADRKRRMAELRQQLIEDTYAEGDRKHGRQVFQKTCASCHRLFGEGGKIGPDITGSNRTNLDYLLENAVDPSAVVGRDYQMTVFVLENGRVITGIVQSETASAVTVRTANDTVVVAKSDIDVRKLSTQSLMPEGQFDQLGRDELRDLVAYLTGSAPVAFKGPAAPIDKKTGRVPNAQEGEALKIIGKTGGSARSQNMSSFKADRWSGNDHLWWTGAKKGDRLTLEIDVQANGMSDIEIVFTKAADYGVVQMWLDKQPLGGPVDLYDTQVVTTGVITFKDLDLARGPHQLAFEILGKNPKAKPAMMVGIDYVRVTRPSLTESAAPAEPAIRASASYCFPKDHPSAMHDGILPASSGDTSIPRMTWWNRDGRQWAHYRFRSPRKISSAQVYWYDDKPGGGGCTLPRSWRLIYRDGNQWKPVNTNDAYGVDANKFNRVEFTPIETSELRLEIQTQPGISAGILEWQVE